MKCSIFYLNNSSGPPIPYFTQNETIWLSAVEVARLLNYAKPHGVIKRSVSVSNQKKFVEFCFESRVPKIQPNRIFINFSGFQELLNRHGSHPLAADLSTTTGFLNSTENSKSVEAYQALIDILATPAIESSRKKLAEIPEIFATPLGIKQSLAVYGCIYLMQWKNLGKVGKTVCFSTRMQQRFKKSEILWFCTCENMDLLEREILEKLDHLGALVKNQGSAEIFDPSIISFKEVENELKRLALQINQQYADSGIKGIKQSLESLERIQLKQDYIKFATVVVKLAKELAAKYPKESISLLE